MSSSFTPHNIHWTGEKAERLWSWISSRRSYETLNFAHLAGDEIIKFAGRNGVSWKGKVLDFGCGTGVFLEKLLLRGITCEGIDFSRTAVEMAMKRLSRYEKPPGATLSTQLPTPYSNEEFSVVFMLETIEHVLDSDLILTAEEVRRILTHGGFLVISTPNEEDLPAGETLCPECGAIYHRGQHVQSWNVERLTSFMTDHGFKTIACKTKNLRAPSKLNLLRDAMSILTDQSH